MVNVEIVTMSSEMMPEIDLDDAMCKICLEIFVEPITMPCQHRLCKVKYSNKYAPIERARYHNVKYQRHEEYKITYLLRYASS